MDHKKTFNDFLQHSLNPQQQKAVTALDGSFLVIAGAGSGKTRVITARIANLILNSQKKPSSIVALTFTNKAAKEMQERIKHFLGTQNNNQLPFIGTFHSYCLRLLKQNQEKLDYPFFSILDEDDQQKILGGIISRNNLQKEFSAKQLSYQISKIKNNATNQEALQALYIMYPMLEEIYHAYETEKKASKCLDFDDLLLEALKLFAHKDFKREFQETVRHILVDEYQDTNVVQHELLKRMAQDAKEKCNIDSICVVGDEDQSIYSWRGATIANIINFKKDFPKTETIKIEQNYRSVQPILDIANHVIKNNKKRNPKKLWSEKKGSDRIRLLTCLSEYQEGDIIAALCQVAVSQKHKLSSMAVLYRTHFQSRAIEEALIRNSIPYKMIGGVTFYERKEVKDLLAYLRLIINPFDRASFFRVINVPLRGLGNKFEELFYDRWHNEAFLTFIDIAKKMREEGHVTGNKSVALKEFLGVFDHIKPTDKPSIALEEIISQTQYIKYLKDTYDLEDANARIDNIKELVNSIKYLEANKVTAIDQFLDEVALMQEKMDKNNINQDAILMMTLHAAKGLEFDTVILTGLEDGLLPSSRSIAQEETLEEERRLFYVGITRAKERLLLTRSRYRYAYKSMVDQLPSRFLEEIPTASVPHQDCSYWKPYDMKDYCTAWFGSHKQSSSVMTFGTAKIEKKGETKKESVKEKKIVESKSEKSSSKSLPFKLNQPVQHAKFGIGIVKIVEMKNDTTFYITVDFKNGKKKVAAQFLKAI